MTSLSHLVESEETEHDDPRTHPNQLGWRDGRYSDGLDAGPYRPGRTSGASRFSEAASDAAMQLMEMRLDAHTLIAPHTHQFDPDQFEICLEEVEASLVRAVPARDQPAGLRVAAVGLGGSDARTPLFGKAHQRRSGLAASDFDHQRRSSTVRSSPPAEMRRGLGAPAKLRHRARRSQAGGRADLCRTSHHAGSPLSGRSASRLRRERGGFCAYRDPNARCCRSTYLTRHAVRAPDPRW